MSLPRDEIVARLNKLITLNKDSAKGFARAENDAEDDALADWFSELTAERAELVDDLQDAVNRLGEEPEAEGSSTGMLARGWLNIKSAMTIERDMTDELILADRLEHEDDVLARYQELRVDEYPQAIADLLERQRAYISRIRQELVRREQSLEAGG